MQQIEKLCGLRRLGKLTAPPAAVSGGYLHRMFRVETAAGVYAVKLLNPDIMLRPEALDNMRLGEQAALALREQVPLCAARDGLVTELDGAYYIIYDWVEGAAVFVPEIMPAHCRVMGDLLGRIHRAGVTVPGMTPCGEVRKAYGWPVKDERLARWDEQARAGQCALLNRQVISHRDLDPKNVLWQGMKPCIIDWEAAGYVNPWQELIELLNYWASDKDMVHAMLEGYGRHMNLREAPWEAALAAGMDGMLGWLHYNLRRSAGLEGSGPEDKAAGEEHVSNTLRELEQYEERAAFLRRLLV